VHVKGATVAAAQTSSPLSKTDKSSASPVRGATASSPATSTDTARLADLETRLQETTATVHTLKHKIKTYEEVLSQTQQREAAVRGALADALKAAEDAKAKADAETTARIKKEGG